MSSNEPTHVSPNVAGSKFVFVGLSGAALLAALTCLWVATRSDDVERIRPAPAARGQAPVRGSVGDAATPLRDAGGQDGHGAATLPSTETQDGHRLPPASAARVSPPAASATAIPALQAVAAPIMVDPRVEAVANRSLPETERLAALAELRHVSHEIAYPSDLEALAAVMRNRVESDTLRHETAVVLMNSTYRGLTDDVRSVLASIDEGPRFRSFCVQYLATIVRTADAAQKRTIVEDLRRLLGDRDVPVRREALLALVRERDPAGVAKCTEWLYAPDEEALRDLVIRCARELGRTDAMPEIRKYLDSTNGPARIAAIVTLSEWRDAGSRGAIEMAAASGDVRVRRAAEGALARFAAQSR